LRYYLEKDQSDLLAEQLFLKKMVVGCGFEEGGTPFFQRVAKQRIIEQLGSKLQRNNITK